MVELAGRAVTREGVLPVASMEFENGLVRKIERTAGEASGGSIILPGYIDVHNHGAVGVDVNSATAEDLLRVAEFLARSGVTAWLPTLVPDSEENYARVVSEIDRLMEMQEGKAVAQAVGVHYEGVYANEHMCGALRPEFFKTYSSGSTTPAFGPKGGPNATPPIQEGSDKREPPRPPKGRAPLLRKEGSFFGELPKLTRGVHMMTIAPEIDGGIELVGDLVSDGWVVSIGHTRADAETLDAAFGAGARHVTHFFNAMTGVHHRDLGVAGWALANPGVTFDIIADGIHVDPRMLDLACRAKSPAKVCLISDSVAPTGLGDGVYELWGERLTVENGRTRNDRGSIAGSVITMADAVRRMRSLGYAWDEIAAMSSGNSARLLGLSGRGSLEADMRADIVALDDSGAVVDVWVGGQVVVKSERKEL